MFCGLRTIIFRAQRGKFFKLSEWLLNNFLRKRRAHRENFNTLHLALGVCATKLAAGPEILQLCTLLQYPGFFSRAIHKIALADSPNMNSAQEVMESIVTLKGSFSAAAAAAVDRIIFKNWRYRRGTKRWLTIVAVSKPNFASKYSLKSSRRDLHNALLCTVLESNPKLLCTVLESVL